MERTTTRRRFFSVIPDDSGSGWTVLVTYYGQGRDDVTKRVATYGSEIEAKDQAAAFTRRDKKEAGK